MRTPEQLKVDEPLVSSWTVEHPRFYGEPTTYTFVDALLEVESCLRNGMDGPFDPRLCRVLAAYHGPKGAKVPLSISTFSGCGRPAFVGINQWLRPNYPSCYGGGCYLFHARAVPAKKDHEVKVRAHTTPKDSVLAAALLGRHFGVPIRDNQSSDGSMSMALTAKNESSSQMLSILQTLNEAGFSDVPYLCFSSAYIRVPNHTLEQLKSFSNLIVHVTVSGWHSREENSLRLSEFERYATFLPTVCLRVVNRQDWAGIYKTVRDGAAQCEDWLLNEIYRRGFCSRVIRTPFHSVHPFPGSRPGKLGSRHLAGIGYSSSWNAMLPLALGECCTTGKCKTCPTRCGVPDLRPLKQESLLAARAFEAMLRCEVARKLKDPLNPLAIYTKRMLARKAMELYQACGDSARASSLSKDYMRWDQVCSQAELSSIQRRRLSNDCHALVVDGLDRHGLWRNIKNPQ